MKIYSHISSGKHHPVHCEDHLFHEELSDGIIVAAVMDGCSSGTESHFASASYLKSLRKACKMLPNMKEIFPEMSLEQMTNEDIGTYLLKQLYEDLKKLKRMYFLEVVELLSTVLLVVYRPKTKHAWICVSGDGYVAVNGSIEEIDQNNMPDYLAYHLDQPFDQWLEHHTKIIKHEAVNDVSISTDGLGKLIPINHSYTPTSPNPLSQFLTEKPKSSKAAYLMDLYQDFTTNRKYTPLDDIAIVRMINDD